jgi:hypothetical protein
VWLLWNDAQLPYIQSLRRNRGIVGPGKRRIGKAAALEALPKITQVERLTIAIGAQVGGEFLVIDPME